MLYRLFLAAGIVLLTACGSGEDKPAEVIVPEQPIASKNTPAFNESFEKLLNAYISVKDALVEYDTAKANAAALVLEQAADSLKITEIKGDTTGTIQQVAKDFAGTIVGSCKGLVGETDLTKKKREFQMISEAMYNLVRTVKYDKQIIYHQSCPMAFNDEEEAAWISTSNKIVNPYLGSKHPKYKEGMLHCGEVKDSIDFRKQ
ncbi:MAG: DUF3347 domain-containing protein [Sphingobacteriales bacterium]|jgi:Protein of unknown function (DUF3347)|nr:MAG: DUF3347 domain-containing protein [Sphingobacteriales bacterium]